MKLKNQIYIVLISAVLVFSSCGTLLGTSGNTKSDTDSKSSTTGKVLGSIYDAVMGKLPLSQKNMVGTWDFQGTSCAFESENLLKKAGGVVVAAQVEEKFDETCQKLGINEKNTSFVFNADSTYSARIGGVKISGKYILDTQNKKVRMSYLLGVAHLDASVVVSNRDMKLLFDADSVLKLLKFISQFTNNTSIEVLGKMADMYDGMLLGFDLRKQ